MCVCIKWFSCASAQNRSNNNHKLKKRLFNSAFLRRVIFKLIFWIDVHDDVIRWKHFPRYWPFVPGIHRSPVNSPHKGQWRRALMFSFICAWINAWVNNREAGDLRRHPSHHDVIVMLSYSCKVAVRWMPLNSADDWSTLVQMMVWCSQGHKPSPEPMLTHIHVAIWLQGRNELNTVFATKPILTKHLPNSMHW